MNSVLVVMPRPMSAVGGGITRMVKYLNDSVLEGDQGINLEYFPTRTTDILFLKWLSLLWRLFWFSLFIRFSKCDIVHLHVAPKGSTTRKAIYAKLAQRNGKKIVLHLHGSGYDEYFKSLNSAQREKVSAFFKAADAVIVLGEGWRNFAITELGVLPERAYIVNNGVPDPGISAEFKNSVRTFIFVGNVGERKGVDLLLKAFASLDKRLAWKLVVCGNGELEHYKNLGHSLGLQDDRVVFTGWQNISGVRSHMSAADVFVLPSRAENQPIAILEAMAMGLPVISTAVGDIPNQVIDGKTGFVIERDDLNTLVDRLTKFIEHQELCKTMGNAGRARFLDEYTITSNASKTTHIYEKVSK